MLVKCIDLSHEGKGVCKHDNKVIFVPNMLIGEEAEIEIVEEKKKFSVGKVIEFTKTSEKRIKPSCEFYGECGGCSMMHMSYEDEKNFKTNIVVNNFKKNANVDINIEKFVSGDIENYRNKVILHLEKTKYGFYKSGSNELVSIDHCQISDKEINKIVSAISFNNKDIERVLIRTSNIDNSKMVVLISKYSKVSHLNDVVDRLLKMDDVKSIYHNVHPKMDHVQTGKKFKKIFGVDKLVDEINGVKFSIGPSSFYQINPGIVSKLYSDAIEKAELKKNDKVVDAYCGIGTIGITIANSVKQIVGIELNENAVYDAINNAKLNEIDNTSFIIGRAELLMPGIDNVDVIFLDPPRGGCNIKMIESINEKKIKKIVYVSCNSSTMARDARLLLDNGYKMGDISLYDMFPRTSHVETIAVFSRD